MLRADDLQTTIKQTADNRWVAAKPVKGPLLHRIKDALAVLKGDAEAVTFEEDE